MPTNKYAHYKLGDGVYFSIAIINGEPDVAFLTKEDGDVFESYCILTDVVNNIVSDNPGDYAWNKSLDKDTNTRRRLDAKLKAIAKGEKLPDSAFYFVTK